LADTKIPSPIEGSKPDPTDLLYDDNFDYSVQRGHVSIAGKQGHLELTMPIEGGHATLSGRFGAHGVFKVLSVPVSGTIKPIRGHLDAVMAPMLHEDWTIDPNAKLSVHLQTCNFQVKHVGTVSVCNLLTKEFEKHKDKYIKQLNAFLADTNVMRHRVSDFWRQAFISRRLSQEQPLWLVIKPTAVFVAPLRAEGNYLNVAFGMKARTELYFQESSPENTSTDLPSLGIVANPSPTLDLTVPVGIDYGSAGQALSKELSKHSIDVGGSRVRVDDLQLRSAGNRLLVQVRLTASEGWFRRTTVSASFFARPNLDRNAGVLSLTDIDFDLTTRNYLLRAAKWFLDPILLQQLQKAARLDLRDFEERSLEKARSEIRKAKANLPNKVDAAVDLDHITLSDVRVTPSQLYVVAEAHGAVSVVLDEIPVHE